MLLCVLAVCTRKHDGHTTCGEITGRWSRHHRQKTDLQAVSITAGQRQVRHARTSNDFLWFTDSASQKKKLNNVCVKMFSDTMLLCRTSPLEKNLTRLQFIIQGVSLERYLTDATLEDTYDRTKFTPILSPSDSLTARKWLCALCYGKQSKTELPIMCKRKSVNAVMLHNCPCATF